MRRRIVHLPILPLALVLASSCGLFAQGRSDSTTATPVMVASFAMGYAPNTYIPALNIGAQVGAYLPELCLPITVIARDAENENKTSISWTSAVTVGAIMCAGVMHPEDVPGLRTVFFYTVVVPLLALNCQHHLVVVGPNGLLGSSAVRLTAFAGWRTDCYSPGITWVRWTPMVGLQQEVNLSDDGGATTGKWLAIAEGVESPVGTHAPPTRLQIALQYFFPSSRSKKVR